MESDHRYYTRRAAEEQRRARHALTAEARERHHELASLFARKANQQVIEERQLANGWCPPLAPPSTPAWPRARWCAATSACPTT